MFISWNLILNVWSHIICWLNHVSSFLCFNYLYWFNHHYLMSLTCFDSFNHQKIWYLLLVKSFFLFSTMWNPPFFGWAEKTLTLFSLVESCWIMQTWPEFRFVDGFFDGNPWIYQISISMRIYRGCKVNG